ncbi:MAG: GTP-binding protein [Planctomycetota bacterium]
MCDAEPEEQDKGHTLQAAWVQGDARGCRWTWIDTPGYDDFVADTNGAIAAADVVVGVHSALGRPNHDFRRELERARSLGKGRVIVVTHCDADNVDFDRVVDELDRAVGDLCVPFDHPDVTGPGFHSAPTIFEVDHHDWRRNLLDRVMDACEDEALLARYLETGTLSDADLHAQIPRAIARGSLVPILACNPLSGVGVEGVLAHSQVVDVDLELYDGKFHDVESDEASFKIAGARAFVDAFQKASPVLLEPVMELEVTIPTDSAGAIFSDLTSHRRAQVFDQSTSVDGAFTTIRAHAPLSLLQSYQRDLKSMTAGEGAFSMRLGDYAPIPASEQQRVLSSVTRGEPIEV